MFAFLALIFVLIVIYFFTSASENKYGEGFNPVNTYTSHTVNIIPPSVAPPPVRSINDSNIQPANLPGQLPIAPYEQIAAMSPLPYQDTTLVKANRQQLIEMLELLKGFLAFEAQEISERSDPTIQLPLNTARSDFHTLQSEVEVLNRNPGLQPTITLSHLNEINANLAYLQREVRLIGAAGPIQGPVYEFTQPVNVVGGSLEGFDNMFVSAMTDTKTIQPPEGLNMNGEENKGTSNGPSNGQIATPTDLENFIARLSAEIIRLSASGTTDPVVNARIVALTQMKSNVQTIIDQVQTGALMPVEIPIMKKDIDTAFPILGKPDEPLPQVIKTLGLPPGLANLLPSNVQKDPNTMREISKLVDKYAETVVNGVSASFAVKYTSPRESDKTRVAKSTIDKTGFPSSSDLDNACNNKFTPDGGLHPVTDKLAALPSDAGRGPSHFDWKQRAKEIEGQVKKRGLKPTDFGIMPEGTKVSPDFSWKGYSSMMCTRLQATMDPALPETCGCPPMDWQGWRG